MRNLLTSAGYELAAALSLPPRQTAPSTEPPPEAPDAAARALDCCAALARALWMGELGFYGSCVHIRAGLGWTPTGAVPWSLCPVCVAISFKNSTLCFTKILLKDLS